MHPVFVLTGSYFAIGAAATAITNRRAGGRGSAERWTKLAVYFLVVHAVIASILAQGSTFAGLALALVLLGLFEILRAARSGTAPGVRSLPGALAVYAALAFAFVRFARDTPASMALFVYVVVLTFDGFSQVTGQLLGRHKLVPRVSPGKTVEGLAGGLVMASLTAWPLASWAGVGLAQAFALAALVAAFALGGDLLASLFKRLCGVKDYGTLIPAHGGVLDRFDSLIAAGGAYWTILGR